MKKQWADPTKRPPSAETLNTPGSFDVFKETMRKIVEKPKTASHGPRAS